MGFYKEGICQRGARCTFIHEGPGGESQWQFGDAEADREFCALHQKPRHWDALVRDPDSGMLVCAPGQECKEGAAGVMCKFFTLGKCKNGKVCRFSHGDDEPPHVKAWIQQAQAVQRAIEQSEKALCSVHNKLRKLHLMVKDPGSGRFRCMPGYECKDVPTNQRCKFFMEGRCQRGKDCAFSHGDEE